MPTLRLVSVIIGMLFICKGHGVILLGHANDANQLAPSSGAPFYAVARVCDANGGDTAGSAVYLQGKYMLTADHVQNRSHVTFDGVKFWARDTAFIPVQITYTVQEFDIETSTLEYVVKEVDMKVIKLLEDPGLPSTLMADESVYDYSGRFGFGRNAVTVEAIGTLIGWGRGKGSTLSSSAWNWGGVSTEAKRWGTNEIEATLTVRSGNYEYAALQTNLDSDGGADEAAAALYDSGSGIFLESEGLWYLVGLTTAVQNGGSSTFATPGDGNFFVQIKAYRELVLAALPDLTTYAGWKTDHSLVSVSGEDTADTDGDGRPQLLEFALGGDPHVADAEYSPSVQIVSESDLKYLELHVVRPIGLQGITYSAQTTQLLDDWPSDSSGVSLHGEPVLNGDGTETVTYRRDAPISAGSPAFIRLQVTRENEV